MQKKLFSLILISVLSFAARAQELNCKVRVMADKILNKDKEVFRTMERSITEFMNTRKWTTDEFGPAEKIDCNILINITGQAKGDEDVYTATMSVQSARPIYNTSYTSPLINQVDRDVIFRYSQFTPLQFDDNRVSGNDAMQSNLTALLAFYAYLVLGLDYESFSPKGGQEFFKKAQNIVNNAPEQGKTITGWKAVEGNHNRYWIVDQVLNPRFQALRSVWYSMHREALDNMYAQPAESQKIILNSITTLSQLQKENPGSILLQFFFNAKSDEFASVIAQQPEANRGLYITMIGQIDVPNVQKYNSLNK